jgi:hypothetical protein
MPPNQPAQLKPVTSAPSPAASPAPASPKPAGDKASFPGLDAFKSIFTSSLSNSDKILKANAVIANKNATAQMALQTTSNSLLSSMLMVLNQKNIDNKKNVKTNIESTLPKSFFDINKTTKEQTPKLIDLSIPKNFIDKLFLPNKKEEKKEKSKELLLVETPEQIDFTNEDINKHLPSISSDIIKISTDIGTILDTLYNIVDIQTDLINSTKAQNINKNLTNINNENNNIPIQQERIDTTKKVLENNNPIQEKNKNPFEIIIKNNTFNDDISTYLPIINSEIIKINTDTAIIRDLLYTILGIQEKTVNAIEEANINAELANAIGTETSITPNINTQSQNTLDIQKALEEALQENKESNNNAFFGGLFGSAFTPLILRAGLASAGLGILASGAIKLGQFFTILLENIVPVTAALALLAYTGYSVYENWETINNQTSSLWKRTSDIFDNMIQKFESKNNKLDGLYIFFNEFLPTLFGSWATLALKGATNLLANIPLKLAEKTKEQGIFGSDFFPEYISSFKEGLKLINSNFDSFIDKTTPEKPIKSIIPQAPVITKPQNIPEIKPGQSLSRQVAESLRQQLQIKDELNNQNKMTPIVAQQTNQTNVANNATTYQTQMVSANNSRSAIFGPRGV